MFVELVNDEPEAQEDRGEGHHEQISSSDRLADGARVEDRAEQRLDAIGLTAARDRVPDVLEESGVAGGSVEDEEIDGQRGQQARANKESRRVVVVSIRRARARRGILQLL